MSASKQRFLTISAATDAEAADTLACLTQSLDGYVPQRSVRVQPHGESLSDIARRADAWARAERPAVKPNSPYSPALWLAAAVVLLLMWGLV